jgi:hypothetical protein
MVPGSSGVLATSTDGEGDDAELSQEQFDACARQVRRAMERVSHRFPIARELLEEFDDAVASGAADPLLAVLASNAWAQLALVAAGIVVKRLPEFGGTPEDSPPAEVKG